MRPNPLVRVRGARPESATGVKRLITGWAKRSNAPRPSKRTTRAKVKIQAQADAVRGAVETGRLDALAELAPNAGAEVRAASETAYHSGLSSIAVVIAIVSAIAVVITLYGIRPQDRYDN